MIKRIIIVSTTAFVALFALTGASYFMGWALIDNADIRSDTVTVTEVRFYFGLMIICVLYAAIRFLDFISFLWKESGRT